jgi:hypothetical protein
MYYNESNVKSGYSIDAGTKLMLDLNRYVGVMVVPWEPRTFSIDTK